MILQGKKIYLNGNFSFQAALGDKLLFLHDESQQPEPDYTPYILFHCQDGDNTFTKTGTTSTLEYKIGQNGEWTSYVNGSSINFGQSYGDLYIRGKNLYGTDQDVISFSNNSNLVNCYGNISTLVDWENPDNGDFSHAIFYKLFYNCQALVSAPSLLLIVNAPNRSDNEGCGMYESMFEGCINLVTAPALPATTLGKLCYFRMFHSCQSLVNAPQLPATTLTQSCYARMFLGCQNLVTAPDLPAPYLQQWAMWGMFIDCYSLTNVKFLCIDPTTATQAINDWLKNTAKDTTGTIVISPDAVNPPVTDGHVNYGRWYLPNNWNVLIDEQVTPEPDPDPEPDIDFDEEDPGDRSLNADFINEETGEQELEIIDEWNENNTLIVTFGRYICDEEGLNYYAPTNTPFSYTKTLGELEEYMTYKKRYHVRIPISSLEEIMLTEQPNYDPQYISKHNLMIDLYYFEYYDSNNGMYGGTTDKYNDVYRGDFRKTVVIGQRGRISANADNDRDNPLTFIQDGGSWKSDGTYDYAEPSQENQGHCNLALTFEIPEQWRGGQIVTNFGFMNLYNTYSFFKVYDEATGDLVISNYIQTHGSPNWGSTDYVRDIPENARELYLSPYWAWESGRQVHIDGYVLFKKKFIRQWNWDDNTQVYFFDPNETLNKTIPIVYSYYLYDINDTGKTTVLFSNTSHNFDVLYSEAMIYYKNNGGTVDAIDEEVGINDIESNVSEDNLKYNQYMYFNIKAPLLSADDYTWRDWIDTIYSQLDFESNDDYRYIMKVQLSYNGFTTQKDYKLKIDSGQNYDIIEMSEDFE